MKQLHDRVQVVSAIGYRLVGRTRSSISNRLRGFNVRATAEATSVVENRVQQNVELPRVPVDAPATKRVYFEVFRQVHVGEDVKVVGSLEELGAWDVSEGLALQWGPGHRWVGSTRIAADAEFSYKLVKAGADEMGIEWEEGDDRSFDLRTLQSDGVSVSILWGCPAEYSSSVPYSKDEPAVADEDSSTSALSSEPKSAYTARIAIQKELCLGQHLKLVGNSPVLGEWDFRAAPAFTWSPDHVWQLEVELPVDEPVDWKVVQAVEGNNEWCEWQSGENTIIDPSALELSSGDVLQVGCSWEGPSRATIIETAARPPVASSAAQPELIKVTEEPVYGSDGEGGANGAIPSAVQSEPSTSAPQAESEAETTQDATEQESQGEKDPAEKSRGFDLSMFGWGSKGDKAAEAAAVVATSPPKTPPQPQPQPPAESGEAPTAFGAAPIVSPAEPAPVETSAGMSDTAPQSAQRPAAAKPLAVSAWDSVPTQQLDTAARGPAEGPAAAAPQDAVPATVVAQESTADTKPAGTPAAAANADPKAAEDALKVLQASGSGLEDMVLSPEQLSKLAEAGLPDGTKVTIAEQDDVTFELQKGRLGKDEEGSTVIVRGGMDYDSDTGTVTVNSPLGTGPDGILVDAHGKTVEDVKGTSGSTQKPAVKLISPENIADVKPEDEVSVVTKVGAYAGMAAAGLGAATLMGGVGLELADVAIVAGLYGVATAIGTSRNDAVRSKGGAGPVLSALVTASDIAKRMKGTASSSTGTESENKKVVKPVIGKYEKSQTADVSLAGSVPIPTNEEIAAMQAEQALAKKAAERTEAMHAQLGENGMRALEDGVNQVMSSDVQRILQALDSTLSDEDKVVHLVNMLLNGQPAACKTDESLQVEVRAAITLAEEYVSTVRNNDNRAQHAPPVLLAALAMSAVDEMRGVKNI